MLGVSPSFADVRLPAVFSDHMVLQRGTPVPVWGWAEPGEQVTVSVGGQTRKTTASAAGEWRVTFGKLDPRRTTTLTVRGANTLTVSGVLVGEVWLCSGQSNMAMNVRAVQNAAEERASANWPEIRMFTVENAPANEPRRDVKGKWLVASPEAVERFSATAYFFGRHIHKSLDVPVGLINSSVGGTAIELWISAERQKSAPELAPLLDLFQRADAEFDRVAAAKQYEEAMSKWTASGKRGRAPVDPVALHGRKYSMGTLFNGMIAPLIPYALRGALWYQGEANTVPERAPFYGRQLRALVEDWRSRWGQGAFPFAWAQLPNFEGPGRNWPLVREGMMDALSAANTGMGINIDIGEPGDIHPKNKQEVGRRLALWALGAVYGKPGARSGPLPERHAVEGAEVVVQFRHADGGLTAKDGEPLRGFEVAGDDRRWVAASARIDGERVRVSSPEVARPVAARYAWSNNPSCNLYNGAGLPASPFRTERW